MAPFRQTTCRVCGAPRVGDSRPSLCIEHRLEYDRERKARGRRENPERFLLRNRIEAYLAEASAQGATDDQAWWCAVAAIKAYNEGKARPYWLAPFIEQELAYLRANAETFARLDARQWAGVPDFAPVVDQGYELEDDQEVA